MNMARSNGVELELDPYKVEEQGLLLAAYFTGLPNTNGLPFLIHEDPRTSIQFHR